jgi:hypothetical protein
LATIKNRSDTFSDFILTEPISFAETISVIEKAKKGQSAGYDDLPAEAFINNCSALFLHHIFDFCFRFQKIPDVWNKIVINPIPNSQNKIAKCITSVFNRSQLSFICYRILLI